MTITFAGFGRSKKIKLLKIDAVHVNKVEGVTPEKNYVTLVCLSGVKPVDMDVLAQSISNSIDCNVFISGYTGVKTTPDAVKMTTLWDIIKDKIK